MDGRHEGQVRSALTRDGRSRCSLAVLGVVALQILVQGGAPAHALTNAAPMMVGDSPATRNGFRPDPRFTVGDAIKGYRPPGIPDGLGVLDLVGDGAGDDDVHLFMSHELGASFGVPYTLANGTELLGARITAFRMTRSGRILEAGVAYDAVYDRSGTLVATPGQINERGHPTLGFARFCSGRSVEAGTYGFVDDIYFTGEELSSPSHPHGGSEWALDAAARTLWAVPALGRAAWENVAPVHTGNPGTVALLGGDDVTGAPLYLYVGVKDAVGDGSFLDRNGLAVGQLHVWAADDGSLDPEDFHGPGAVRAGTWLPIDVRDPARAGEAGYDSAGYLDDATLRSAADAMGAFSFSRPEDVHENPQDPSQAVYASTGAGSAYPSDTWGSLYRIDLDVFTLTAVLTILHDADALATPDAGIRSPDNLTWSADGRIYVQEDRSTGLFGGATGIEASLWALDPLTGATERIGEIDRTAVAPADATDASPGDLGNWESSGVIDVTGYFHTDEDETLLLLTVQAHSVRDGTIAAENLVEGGQLLFFGNAVREGRIGRRVERIVPPRVLDRGEGGDVDDARARDLSRR